MSEEKTAIQDNQVPEQAKEEKPAIALKDGQLEINDDSFFFDDDTTKQEEPKQEVVDEETHTGSEQEEADTEDAEGGEEAEESSEEPVTDPKSAPDTIEEDGITKYKVIVQGEVQYVPLKELLNGYQRQSDYTKKTQKLSEEKKKIEQERQKINDLPRTVELQSQYKLTAEELQGIVSRANVVVKDQYNIDEFDENFDSIKSAVVTELANEIKAKKEAESKFMAVENYLKQNDPDYEKISALAMEMFENELPLSQVKKLQAARVKGDPMPFLDLYRTASERFQSKKQKPTGNKNEQGNLFQDAANQANNTRTQPQKKVEPPNVESGYGMQKDNQPDKKVDLSLLRGKSTTDQARLLLELGLV